MKAILLSLLCCTAVTFTHAQEVVVGAQGGFGSTWLINNNVSDQAANLDAVTSFGPVFGIEAGYLFKTTSNVKLGVMVEGNYSVVNQKYTGEDSAYTYTAQDQVKYIQVPVLFHLTGKSFFFEAGPQFSFLSNANGKLESSPDVPYFTYADRDISAGFKKSVVSIAFGVGGHFNVAPNLYVDTRLRFAYGLTDATVDAGSAANRDLAFGVDQQTGIASYYANRAQKGEYAYKATSLATGHLLVGLTYRIPTEKKEKSPMPK